MTSSLLADSATMITHPQLYLLTNDDEFALLYQKLEIALATGAVSLLQVRRKQVLAQSNGREQVYSEAQQLLALATRYNVAMVMNDDIALAQQLGIGVHLGQGDGDVTMARQALGDQIIIGRTCHQSLDLVQAALQEGANYAAMGAVFASTTKPKAQIVSREALVAGAQQGIDLCVIGGITAENIGELRGMPIRYVAVVGDILNLPVTAIAARCELWQQELSHWYK